MKPFLGSFEGFAIFTTSNRSAPSVNEALVLRCTRRSICNILHQ
jgi:hypothetical protein